MLCSQVTGGRQSWVKVENAVSEEVHVRSAKQRIALSPNVVGGDSYWAFVVALGAGPNGLWWPA